MGVKIPDELVTAEESGRPVRVHTRDGEVLVARVLQVDESEFRYVVLTSSRPERYGVCDSTGFGLRLDEVDRVVLLAEPRQGVRGPRPTPGPRSVPDSRTRR